MYLVYNDIKVNKSNKPTRKTPAKRAVGSAALAGGLLEWRPQHPALELRRAQLLGALTPCWGFMGSAAPLTAYLAQACAYSHADSHVERHGL